MAIGSSPARFIAGNDVFLFDSSAGASEAGPDVTNVEVMIFTTVDAWVRITKGGVKATKSGKANQFIAAGTFLVFAAQPSAIVSAVSADDSPGTAMITWLA